MLSPLRKALCLAALGLVGLLIASPSMAVQYYEGCFNCVAFGPVGILPSFLRSL